MNFVYLLTNVSKESFPKYYIGSKEEALVVELSGINTIISMKSNQAYYGSSTCPIMYEDLKRGDVFVAEILESTTKRLKVRELETSWLEELDVMNNKYFYNKSNRALNMKHNPYAIANKYGETDAIIANSYSSMGKRNKTAIACGFKNAYDLGIFIVNKYRENNNWAEIAKELGVKNRHFPKMFTKHISDYNKFLSEDPREYFESVIKMYTEKASIELIAETLDVDKLSVMKAISLRVPYNEVVAMRFGITSEALGKLIAKDILKGRSFNQIGKELDVDIRVVQRVFIKYFQSRFKISDLE